MRMVDGDELWSRVATGTDEIIHVRKTEGLVGACVQTAKVINIPNAYEDDRFNREIDKHTGYLTRSMLVCPVKSEDGEVVGAIQMINKKDDEKGAAFSDGDLRTFKCWHHTWQGLYESSTPEPWSHYGQRQRHNSFKKCTS